MNTDQNHFGHESTRIHTNLKWGTRKAVKICAGKEEIRDYYHGDTEKISKENQEQTTETTEEHRGNQSQYRGHSMAKPQPNPFCRCLALINYDQNHLTRIQKPRVLRSFKILRKKPTSRPPGDLCLQFWQFWRWSLHGGAAEVAILWYLNWYSCSNLFSRGNQLCRRFSALF